jgi:hypothetical protein
VQPPCGKCGSTSYIQRRTRADRIVRCTDCPPGMCDGCGRDTVTPPFEWYTVKDHIWAETGLGTHDAVLCVGCLEQRLGRQLHPEDFADVPTNKPSVHNSERLLHRKGYQLVYVQDEDVPPDTVTSA